MYNRRTWLAAVLAGGSTWLLTRPDRAFAAPVKMVIYKTPTCGCCKEWVTHVKDAGFVTEVHDLDDVAPIKTKHRVPAELGSCHTALVGGYVIEGHVPADLIHKILRDKPAFVGLAVPGMVMGSPGMEVGSRKEPYTVVAWDKANKVKTYAKR